MLFVVNADFHGTLYTPPTTARVSIKAPGATTLKIVDWTIFDPFLKPKLVSLLIPDNKDPVHVLF